jgi:hypothetical protein
VASKMMEQPLLLARANVNRSWKSEEDSESNTADGVADRSKWGKPWMDSYIAMDVHPKFSTCMLYMIFEGGDLIV